MVWIYPSEGLSLSTSVGWNDKNHEGKKYLGQMIEPSWKCLPLL